MPEWIINLVLKGWLVAAFVLFAAIIIVTFLPRTRGQMDRHARIPFLIEEDRDGRA